MIERQIENRALIRDFVAWVAREPRSYEVVMDAWRTSCPRLQVWEDAVDLGLVLRRRDDGGEVVSITPRGETFLQES